jgi:hypothetical protein
MLSPLLSALDAFIADDDRDRSRPEAIREMLTDHLRKGGYLKPPGVIFVEENGDGPGARLRKTKRK